MAEMGLTGKNINALTPVQLGELKGKINEKHVSRFVEFTRIERSLLFSFLVYVFVIKFYFTCLKSKEIRM